MTINYSQLQTNTKTLLQSFGAVPLTVRLLNNTTISTIGVFDNWPIAGGAKNIDTLQNPTSLAGETARIVYVPGIDFYNATSQTTTTPQVSGTVEWTINLVLYKKIIRSVASEMPIPNTPILFTLGVE